MNEVNEESKYLKKLQILNVRDKHVFYHKIPIQVITLDSFIDKHNIQSIDLLKIDTEGYEFNVLKGYQSTVKKLT